MILERVDELFRRGTRASARVKLGTNLVSIHLDPNSFIAWTNVTEGLD